jgi:hypothetical protein
MDPVRLQNLSGLAPSRIDRAGSSEHRHFHHHYAAKRGIVHGLRAGADFVWWGSLDIYRASA